MASGQVVAIERDHPLIIDFVTKANQTEIDLAVYFKHYENKSFEIELPYVYDSIGGKMITGIEIVPNKVAFDSVPQRVMLKFVNLVTNATYRGTIQFHNPDDEYKVPFELNLVGHDAIKFYQAPSVITKNYVRNDWFKGMLPKSLQSEEISVLLKNSALDSIRYKWTSRLHTETTDYFDTIGGESLLSINWNLNNKIRAGEHTGEIIVQPDGRFDQLSVPFTLNVRNGVLWVLVTLLAGLIIGVYIKILDEKKDAVLLFGELLSIDLSRISGSRLEWFLTMQKTLKRQLQGAQNDAEIEELSRQIQSLKIQLNETERLQEIELKIDRVVDSDKVTFGNLLAEAWLSIKENKLDEAETHLNDAEKLIPVLAMRSKGAVLPDQLEKDRSDSSIDRDLEKSLLDRKDKPGFLYRHLIKPPSLKFLLNWILPIAYAMTLFGTLLIGIDALYIKGDPTFGDDAIWDYMKVFLYGVTAAVLTNIAYGASLKGLLNQLNG